MQPYLAEPAPDGGPSNRPSLRISLLDSVRGISLLGILLLNISGFGLPSAGYLNPAYAGQPSISDSIVWTLLNIFAQGAFLSMFAILFGGALQLLQKRGRGWNLKRLFWLGVFGFIHTIFLWDGDILLSYSLVGFGAIMLICSSESNDNLMRTGILFYLIGLGLLLSIGLLMNADSSSLWTLDPEALRLEAAWKLAGGFYAWVMRFDMMLMIQYSVIFQYGWELIGMMLIGAALMHSGWLKGIENVLTYRRQGLLLVGFSLAINIPASLFQWWLDWDFIWGSYYLQIPKDLSASLQGLGYIALWYGYGSAIQDRPLVGYLAKVGRMSLSNYLLQSLICIMLFYRFGWYQQLDRLSLLLVVPAIWCINIMFSVLWLRWFDTGPAEWLWRALTGKSAS